MPKKLKPRSALAVKRYLLKRHKILNQAFAVAQGMMGESGDIWQAYVTLLGQRKELEIVLRDLYGIPPEN